MYATFSTRPMARSSVALYYLGGSKDTGGNDVDGFPSSRSADESVCVMFRDTGTGPKENRKLPMAVSCILSLKYPRKLRL